MEHDVTWLVCTYFCFNDIPAFAETSCKDLPHFFSAGKVLLSEQFELLVVPVVDVSALNQSGAGYRFTYISTAGGAFLEWLEGKVLPGVEALRKS